MAVIGGVRQGGVGLGVVVTAIGGEDRRGATGRGSGGGGEG